MSRHSIASLIATAFLTTGLTLAGAATAGAQWDPESGDTGQGWEPPPPQQQQPPPQQQQQQQPPPQQQQPPPQQQQEQPSWFNQDQERPPALQNGEQPPSEEGPSGETDHDQVGAGLSFFGVNRIDVTPAGNAFQLNIPLATVGARIWFGSVGLDLGLGLGTTTQKTYNNCPDNPATPMMGDCADPQVRTGGIDGAFALGLHVGVPIAAAVSQHATFLIIPEVGFAYGKATFFSPVAAEQDIDASGLQFDVGVRVGGELHFGAIGLPNLSLQLTVGLGFRYLSNSAANSVPVEATDAPLVDFEDSEISIRTIANDLANGTIRVNYYF